MIRRRTAQPVRTARRRRAYIYVAIVYVVDSRCSVVDVYVEKEGDGKFEGERKKISVWRKDDK